MKTHSFSALLVTASLVGLAGCGSSSSGDRNTPTPETPAPTPDPVSVNFEVQVTNLTASQPLSPIAVVAHDPAYRLFNLGEAASESLEQLAEGGDNAPLIADAEADSSVVATQSGSGPLPPGATEVLMISIEEDAAADLQFSLVSMLVNTNDALTAARNLDVSSLGVGDSMSVRTLSYDSGTEANSELPGTIPGPADGGEGFNAVRDDIADAIRGHSGVVTVDDGLTGSVLTEAHRWDNPVATVTISRVQ